MTVAHTEPARRRAADPMSPFAVRRTLDPKPQAPTPQDLHAQSQTLNVDSLNLFESTAFLLYNWEPARQASLPSRPDSGYVSYECEDPEWFSKSTSSHNQNPRLMALYGSIRGLVFC